MQTRMSHGKCHPLTLLNVVFIGLAFAQVAITADEGHPSQYDQTASDFSKLLLPLYLQNMINSDESSKEGVPLPQCDLRDTDLKPHVHAIWKRQASFIDHVPNITKDTMMNEEEAVEDRVKTTATAKTKKRIWENGVLKRAMMKYIVYVLQIISLAFGILSVAAVIFAVIVFSNKRMKSRVALLVTAFNVTEGFKVVMFTFHRVWKLVLRTSQITWTSAYARYFIHFVTWLPDAMGRISLLLNLIITIDRFVILAFPLKSINRKVVVYPRLTIAAVVVTMILFQSSNLILVTTMVAGNFNRTRRFMEHEMVAEIAIASPRAMFIYRVMHVVASVCFRYIPLIITITLNIMTIASLIYHNRVQQHTTGNGSSAAGQADGTKTNDAGLSKAQARKRQNNVMIVGSTLIFSFLVAVKPLVRVISMFHPTFGEGKLDLHLYTVINEIGLLLDIASPMVTFLSYCKLSSVFRHVFLRFFFKPPPSSDLTKPRMSSF